MKRSVEMRQARAKLVSDAQQLMPATGSTWTPEARSKFEAMMVDVDQMKADIDKIEKLEAISDELQQPVNGAAGHGGGNAFTDAGAAGSGVDPKILEGQQRAYRSAFRTYLQRGLQALNNNELNLLRSQGRSAEYRDQDNTTGPGGGYTVPTGFANELEVALKQYGGMRAACRTITTAIGNALPWPTTNDTQVMGRRLGANAVTNPAVVSNQAFGQVTFNAYTYTSDLIRIPNELLNDSAFDLVSEVSARGLERVGRIQNAEFTNLAPGAGGPGGMIPQARVAVTGATGETTSIIYDNVIDLEHAVDPAYRTAGCGYMCHDTTLAALRKIRDNYGRPLFGAGLEDGAPDTLNGRPIFINQDMPVMAASAKSLAFGLFPKFVIRDVQGSAVVVRLNELYALQNETGFVMFMRSDAQLLDAGTHPIAVFQNSAT